MEGIIKASNGFEKAIVTGASSGIGKAIANMLTEVGYDVYGIGRKFNDTDYNFNKIVLDLLDTKALTAQIEKLNKAQDISILVNNAGVGYYGIHETLSPDEISTMVRTNLEVPLILSNLLVSTLKKNNGFIINISSHTATAVNPHGCAYGATKAGLFSFSKSLFEEERKYGLKVIDIQPDMTDTNLYRNANFGVAKDVLAYLAPDDVANAVKYAITQRDGCAITCINLKPQLNRISRNK